MKTDAMQIITRPLAPFGTEVAGVDFEQPLAAATVEQIRAQWIESGLLLFRGAGTSTEAHLRLSRCFGEPQPAATTRLNREDNPYLMELVQNPSRPRPETYTVYEIDGQPRTGYLTWHWDQAFTPEIVRGAVLRMVEPARLEGRTGFIDAIAAYERLPATLQQQIEGLEVVYHFTARQEDNWLCCPNGLKILERGPNAEEAFDRYREDFPPVVHPLVITQYETGRKALKISPMHAQYVLGMKPDESTALLRELARYLLDERHAYFHTWQMNDMVVWDNWRIIHSVTGVAPDVHRYAQRTTIAGDYKLGRYLDPALAGTRPKRELVD